MAPVNESSHRHYGYRFPWKRINVIESAGLVVYRGSGDRLEVLLVHPSGNYNRRAPWGIPKGLPDEDEPSGPRRPCAKPVKKRGSSLAGESSRQTSCRWGSSNTNAAGSEFMRLPPPRRPAPNPERPVGKSIGRSFCRLPRRARIHPDQLPLLDRLVEYLATGGDRAD